MSGRLAAQNYTDEQLAAMTYVELEAIAHGTLSYKLIHQRIHNNGMDRRTAISRPAGRKGCGKSKNHPFRKFKGDYYSKGNADKHAQVEENWETGKYD